MGSSSAPSPPISPAFLAVFRARADPSGAMTFDRFMELALYHPDVGYYRKSRPRVGRTPGTDFYTSSTSGPIFGELVSAAAAHRLRAAGRDPASHTFVELGAEPGTGGVLAGVKSPFAGVRVIELGQPIQLAGSCVVFSNELFDAQPFRRTVARQGRWREGGVALRDDALVEIELETDAGETPAGISDGYCFDQPQAATRLAEAIAAGGWQGLFLAFDYGKTLRELLENTPQGTARAYYRHTQSNDLLAHPGDQDLTCHVCWDWLSDALRRNGFSEPALDFQEAFFIRQAGSYLAEITAADAARFSPRKLALMQLLHPSQMGQKFQVLHALR